MTAGPFTDAEERFPLGVRNGFMAATEPVSDTAVTPFGLTLRTAPTCDNVAHQGAAGGGLTMATEKMTTVTTDGNGADVDTGYDVADDI